ncbi:hypothetical protein Q5P01_002194 [Channa striata]|uniref:Chemokine interleukin-8-like domain-containing protein n=1 Tax=Channa striata TaxID=64152 RepID=A0AA88NSB9_CHASR|nr:hypothetical protein Q5P01_002194 [Channa striata]
MEVGADGRSPLEIELEAGGDDRNPPGSEQHPELEAVNIISKSSTVRTSGKRKETKITYKTESEHKKQRNIFSNMNPAVINCCFGFYKGKLRKDLIMSYYETDNHCPKTGIISMMGRFIISVLMALLLQQSEGDLEREQHTTSKPDNSVHYGEFCLHVSDDSQWTSSTSGTEQPSKSANAAKEPTQKHNGVQRLPMKPELNRDSNKQAAAESTQSPTQPTLTYGDSTELMTVRKTLIPMEAPPVAPQQAVQRCESCNITTDLDNVDIKDIHFLDVKMQSLECSLIFYLYTNVSLSDGNILCLDQDQQEFQTVLKKLEEKFYQTPENFTDGCHCKDQNMQPPVKASPGTSTRVWAPTETCNSTEFIQTLTNGSEVCVTALGLLEYINVPRLKFVQQIPDEPQHAKSARFEEVSCLSCHSIGLWHMEPQNIKSLEMNVQSMFCPITIYVRLKTGEDLCMDSDQPRFMDLLEKLQEPTP